MTHTTHISALKFLTIASLCVVLLLVPKASAQPNSGDPRISGSIEPVAEFLTNDLVFLTITLEIDKEWHTYWPGINDTGYGISVEFKPVDGITFGDPVFPTPMRYIAPGDILDHIYEDQIQIHVPVQVDGSVVAETPIPIEATVDYLICKEVCIPESIVVSGVFEAISQDYITNANHVLDIMNGSKPYGSVLQIPRAMSSENNWLTVFPEYWKVDAPEYPEIHGQTLHVIKCGNFNRTLHWDKDSCTLYFKDATRIEFFPTELCTNPADLIAEGESNSDSLTITFDRKFEEDPTSPARISGRLRVHNGDDWNDYDIDYTQPLTQEINP